MITDGLGAGMDYAPGLEKPALYIDVPLRACNDDACSKLKTGPLKSFIRDIIGRILSLEAFAQAGAEIPKLLRNPDAFQQNIGEIRRERVFNYATSAVAAATAIQEMFARAWARCSTTGDRR